MIVISSSVILTSFHYSLVTHSGSHSVIVLLPLLMDVEFPTGCILNLNINFHINYTF